MVLDIEVIHLLHLSRHYLGSNMEVILMLLVKVRKSSCVFMVQNEALMLICQ